jgi:hypothetical protein
MMLMIGSLLLPFIPPAQTVLAQVDSVTYDRPVEVVRKEKPRRRARRPRPKPTPKKPRVVEKVLLLAVQYRILKVGSDGVMEETNATLNTFSAGDRLRLAVKANQDGYLYVIHQPGKGMDGQIIFPQSRVNNGQNYVSRNQELLLPSNCDPNIARGADCSFPVLAPAGQEYFTVIFSRDMLLDLPNEAAQAGVVRASVIEQIYRDSEQSIERMKGDTKYAIKLVNINKADNEEIIQTLVLNKGG